MQYERYAVFVTPPKGALGSFGAHWLGWDCARGSFVTHPAIDGLPAPVEDLTATPRKYGFHGTIKPPFHLAEGKTAQDILARLREIAETLAPIHLQGLKVAQMGRFVALVVDGQQDALARSAARVVVELDPFRAPPSDAELTRRRRRRLTARQEAYLEQWGYPYVLDEFRFHMTLSGSLTKDQASIVADRLRDHLCPILPAPYVIADLTLLGSDQKGMFHEIHRVPLSG